MGMRRLILPLVLAPAALLLLSVSDKDAVPNCEPIPLYPQAINSAYPAHRMSPQESSEHYNTIFIGEVVVPTRKCSIGYCAGIRVKTAMKGEPSGSFLVRISHADQACGPTKFHHKGISWLVFGNSGTSKGGTQYLDVEDDGPSFESERAPDFATLQRNYTTLRAHLDQAIKDSIPRAPSR
jgi:hypothetical protein